MTNVDDTAQGLSALFRSIQANYAWYLRDGFPGLIALLVLVLINLSEPHVWHAVIGWVRDTRPPGGEPVIIAAGLLVVFVAPGAGAMFGGAGGWLLARANYGLAKFFGRWPWSGHEYGGEVWEQAAWLAENNQGAWLETEYLHNIPVIARTFGFLCLLAAANGLALHIYLDGWSLRLWPWVAVPVVLFVLLLVISTNGESWYSYATNRAYHAHYAVRLMATALDATIVAASGEAALGADVQITVTLKNPGGRDIADKSVELLQLGNAHSTITPHRATTDAGGVAVFRVSNATSESVTYGAMNVSDWSVLAASTTIAYTAPAPAPRGPLQRLRAALRAGWNEWRR